MLSVFRIIVKKPEWVTSVSPKVFETSLLVLSSSSEIEMLTVFVLSIVYGIPGNWTTSSSKTPKFPFQVYVSKLPLLIEYSKSIDV